jgi:hypothetical protein
MTRNTVHRTLAALVVLLTVGACAQVPGSEGATGFQPEIVDESADPILAEDILEHVEILSSDLFEGRGAATDGERRAAAYIVSVISDYERVQPGGVDGSWFQEFPVKETDPPAGFDHEHARNVLAIIPGSDPELAHEVIVIGAHYDHVGKEGLHGGSLGGHGEIHNGADDNASGSAVLLELVSYFATTGTPLRRSLMIQWYSAEELGLVGSRYWVEHPTIGFEQVITMLNFDMVGRMQGGTLLVGGTGTSPVLGDLVESLRGYEGLEFVVDPPGSAPSDNSNFYEKEVPVLFLFTGIHEDYHRSTDDAHLLNASGTERIAKLARRIVRELDAADVRPAFTSAPGMANYWVPSVHYGLTFDAVSDDVPGVASVVVLIPDSPAALGSDGHGLVEGDIVLSLDGVLVETVEQLEELLREIDDERTPRVFEVWRLLDADDDPDPDPADDLDAWVDAHERLKIVVTPRVR